MLARSLAKRAMAHPSEVHPFILQPALPAQHRDRAGRKGRFSVRYASSLSTRREVVIPVSIAPSTTTPFHPWAMSAPAKYIRVVVLWKWCQPSVNCPVLIVAHVCPLHLSAVQSCPSHSSTLMSGRHWFMISCTCSTLLRSIFVWSGPNPTSTVVLSSRKYSAFVIAMGEPVGAVAMKLWCASIFIQILNPVEFVFSSPTQRDR